MLREFWERKSEPKIVEICQKGFENNPKGITISSSSLVGNALQMAKWHNIESKNPIIGYSHC
jgi:hypothetical protein